jgi:hypothetical protein
MRNGGSLRTLYIRCRRESRSNELQMDYRDTRDTTSWSLPEQSLRTLARKRGQLRWVNMTVVVSMYCLRVAAIAPGNETGLV